MSKQSKSPRWDTIPRDYKVIDKSELFEHLFSDPKFSLGEWELDTEVSPKRFCKVWIDDGILGCIVDEGEDRVSMHVFLDGKYNPLMINGDLLYIDTVENAFDNFERIWGKAASEPWFVRAGKIRGVHGDTKVD